MGVVVPPREGAVRVRAVVAYDGASFHGFAAQPDLPTVAGRLGATIERVLRTPVELTCAGRTDAGVHARGQVVSFDAPAARLDLERLVRAVNQLCGPELVIRSAELAGPSFSARFSARSRRYRYSVLNTPVPDPLLARTSWHVAHPLQLDLLRLGCDPLLGEQDFSTFCRRPKGEAGRAASLSRRVIDARWEPADEGLLHFWIEADSFCHHMVRSVVAALVDVGRGRLHAGDLRAMMWARDRAVAPPPAPPHGLCLWSVRY
jgi:tRNA pseudouridine38-40 synthase